MRAVILVVLVACTVGESRPVARPEVVPAAERMPSQVLDHQDPAADTSRNPELSRSEASACNYRPPFPLCSAGGADSSPIVVAAAVLFARRRRRVS